MPTYNKLNGGEVKYHHTIVMNFDNPLFSTFTSITFNFITNDSESYTTDNIFTKLADIQGTNKLLYGNLSTINNQLTSMIGCLYYNNGYMIRVGKAEMKLNSFDATNLLSIYDSVD